jgi:hypothetical protein
MYNNERTIQVSPDFVEDALYDRFREVNDRRGWEIYEKKIDDFVALIIDCWSIYWSASYIIDNWLINWTHNTYEEIYNRYLAENHDGKEREKLTEEEMEDIIEEIHEYCQNECLEYDDELQEAISF